MLSAGDKNFCLWVVPPSDGKVRKVRITSRRLLFTATLCAVLFGGVVFVTSDYLRVQVLRAQNYLSFLQVKKERDQLQVQTNELSVELAALGERHRRMMDYESSVRERLSKLSQVLESSELPGVKGALDSAENEGVGGYETDISSKDIEAYLKEVEYDGAKKLSSSVEHPADLVEDLDSVIQSLKRLPLPMPIEGKVNSSFGIRRSPFSGRMRMHHGIDIARPYGSKVFATADGVVKRVTRNRTYGLQVDIEHTPRIVTRFAHLSRSLVKEGELIKRGQTIGRVGSTGRSTGPHLHYEIRVDDKARNPVPYIELGEKLGRKLNTILSP